MKKKGFTLIELIIVIFIIGLIMAIEVPGFWRFYLILDLKNQVSVFLNKMKKIRYEATVRNNSFGIVFYRIDEEWYYIIVRDGNSNGIQLKDIKDGVDIIIEGPDYCSREGWSKVGILNQNIPKIPPEDGCLNQDNPVQFGESDIFSCSSGGTCSPGTIYFMNKSINCMQAIRVFGPTSRITIWSYCTNTNWRKRW